MSTRSPHEALDAFLLPSRLALRCVTRALLLDVRVGPRPTSAILNGGEPVRLRGANELLILVSLSFELTDVVGSGNRGAWQVRSTGYEFAIQRNDGREVLAYQWHPSGQSWMVEPHLHVNGSAMGIDLTKTHCPTGRVTLPMFVRFLILDFGVEPIREDWRDVLRGAES